MLEVRTLNCNNPDEIELFERAFYAQFAETAGPSQKRVWEFDRDNRRLRMKIPYKDQRILVVFHNTSIVAGMSLNVNVENEFQLEMMGFTVPEKRTGIAEGLVLFIVEPIIEGTFVLFLLRDASNQFLKEQNIDLVYSTCSQHLVRGYKLLGFEIAATELIEGEKKYLMKSFPYNL